jgi:hypothetical protein
MILEKDGITIDVSHPSDVARYKKLGYVEAKDAPPVEVTRTDEVAPEKTPEEKNADAIAEANKPIGSKKGKGKS